MLQYFVIFADWSCFSTRGSITDFTRQLALGRWEALFSIFCTSWVISSSLFKFHFPAARAKASYHAKTGMAIFLTTVGRSAIWRLRKTRRQWRKTISMKLSAIKFSVIEYVCLLYRLWVLTYGRRLKLWGTAEYFKNKLFLKYTAVSLPSAKLCTMAGSIR